MSKYTSVGELARSLDIEIEIEIEVELSHERASEGSELGELVRHFSDIFISGENRLSSSTTFFLKISVNVLETAVYIVYSNWDIYISVPSNVNFPFPRITLELAIYPSLSPRDCSSPPSSAHIHIFRSLSLTPAYNTIQSHIAAHILLTIAFLHSLILLNSSTQSPNLQYGLSPSSSTHSTSSSN
jgi:hypothetical protein